MQFQKTYTRHTLTAIVGMILTIDLDKPGDSEESVVALLAETFPDVEVQVAYGSMPDRFQLSGGISLSLENIQGRATKTTRGIDNTAVQIEAGSDYHSTIQEALTAYRNMQESCSNSRFYDALKYLTIPSEDRKEVLDVYLKIVIKGTPLPENETIHDPVGSTFRIDPLALAEVLAKSDAPHEEEVYYPEHFNPWNDLFPRIYGNYDGALDDLFIDALKVTKNKQRQEYRAKYGAMGELALYILAGHDFTEYGTSPRTAWPNPQIADQWDLLITKWEAYRKANETKADGTPSV